MKQFGAGKGYTRYERDNPEAYRKQQFLPDSFYLTV
jgi:hypothetical protein